MIKKFNKHRIVLYCITTFVYIVFSVGIMVFHVKTDSTDNIHYSLGMLGVIAVGSIALILIKDKNDDEIDNDNSK